MRRCSLLFVLLTLGGPAWAVPPDRHCSGDNNGPKTCIRVDHFVEDICPALQATALKAGLSPYFFTRLIWQESRFDPYAVSPANARGIAQFIASTAKLRGLDDVFNPAQSLGASATYLAELRDTFGSLGLAAIAYNGGESRAADFLTGKGGLPKETRDYVRIITGLGPEIWRDDAPQDLDLRLAPDEPFLSACNDLAQNRVISTPKSAHDIGTIPSADATLPAWSVRVASGDTKVGAAKKYRSRIRTCRSIVAAENPKILFKESEIKTRKGKYVVSLMRNTRASATRLCTLLKRKRCDCKIYKN